jgi:pimeloyl-ACP methyl ester carboxylesterase
MHPRLFTTLLLLDPVIHPYSSVPPDSAESPAQMSTFRRDIWPSRKVAAEGYTKSKFYQTWDPRVIERQVKYGLRDLPTTIHPLASIPRDETPVTLSTTKHQEVFTFLRPNYEGSGHEGRPVDRKKQPDVHPGLDTIYPFYRPEVPRVYFRLPEVRPSVLYVFGELSYLSSPEAIAAKLNETGSGVGGSGGIKEGKVKGVILKNVGHLVAMEAVEECADAAAEWISREMKSWTADEDEHRKRWMAKTLVEKQTVDEEWKTRIGGNLRKAKSDGNAKL